MSRYRIEFDTEQETKAWLDILPHGYRKIILNNLIAALRRAMDESEGNAAFIMGQTLTDRIRIVPYTR